MKKILELYEATNWFEEVSRQELCDKNEEVFTCYNLASEDAIIGRGIFDADDFVKAVKYGIELAKEGYDDIEVDRKPIVEEEE